MSQYYPWVKVGHKTSCFHSKCLNCVSFVEACVLYRGCRLTYNTMLVFRHYQYHSLQHKWFCGAEKSDSLSSSFRMYAIISSFDVISIFLQDSISSFPSTKLEVHIYNPDGLLNLWFIFWKDSTRHFHSHCFQTRRWGLFYWRNCGIYNLTFASWSAFLFRGIRELLVSEDFHFPVHILDINYKNNINFEHLNNRNVDIIRLSAYSAFKYVSQIC